MKLVVNLKNTIVDMSRSVINLTPTEYAKIRYALLHKKGGTPKSLGLKQKEIIRKFDLSTNDRELLMDLIHILEPFEWVTVE